MNEQILLLAREIDGPDRSIIATGRDGTIVYWGVGAEELYGWSSDEALGRGIMELTPTDVSRLQAEQIMQILGAGDPWSGEFLVQCKDGSRFIARVTDIPVHDKVGQLLGIVGISRRATSGGGPTDRAGIP